jgi:ABC-type oligopeptide transport system substrate-binding subunit
MPARPLRIAWRSIPALLAAVLLACGDGGAPESKGKGSDGQAAIDVTTLRRGNGPEPDSLDPQRARTDSSLNVIRDLFEGLTAVGGDGKPVAAAAESWTVSADGREYRFRLREGLRWSNGDPLVAGDFVVGMRGWSIRRRRRNTRRSSSPSSTPPRSSGVSDHHPSSA